MSSTLSAFTLFSSLLDLNSSLNNLIKGKNILLLFMDLLMPLKVAFGAELAGAVQTLERSLATVTTQMDVIICFAVVFMHTAWLFATEFFISVGVGKKAFTCIELGLKISPARTKLAAVWPLMSSQMLIEMRSELEIDATFLASKWSGIYL